MIKSFAGVAGILVSVATVTLVCAPSWAQTRPDSQTQPAALVDPGWPRAYKTEGHQVIVHQPQVDRWENYRRIFIRAAVVVRQDSSGKSVYGSIKASADTAVNQEARTVLIGPRKVEELQFSGLKPADADTMKKLILSALPDEQPLTISLDRVLAAVAMAEPQEPREAEVNLDPPPIYASQSPAILVIFAGKPRFQKIEGTALMFAANTNWDVFLDTASAQYYLLNIDHWLSTKDVLKGPWAPADRLPSEISKLPDNENWKDVRANIPGKKPAAVATVIVSTKPAELILTDGPPEFEPIPETKLMAVSNTDSDLFMHVTEKQFYFLTAGRWFRAKALTGPWSAATRDLPADFAAIPDDDDNADILASVPGTPEAQEAVIQASIPKTATVNRKDVTVTVAYQGEPKFVVIDNTPIKYAVNSPNSVFLVDNKYYCCYEGVWFVSAANKGPWAVCDAVPAVIYTIPASHPTYNVTYVKVYSSTPDTVVVGATPGYSGQYVAAGVVLFGAGVIVGALLDDDDDWWGCHYHSSYFSYGCGASYSHYHGGFYTRGAAYYGPYGGAGAWSAYNPSTGVYSRGAYRYGPSGSASVRTAYNPWTGNSAGRATVKTPYGSWGRSVVTDGDDWIQGGHRSGPNAAIGGVRTSEGSGVVAGKTRWGEGAVVAKDDDGDLYAARDGNVYKRDENGDWSQREDGDWKPAEGNPRTPRTTSAGAQGAKEAAPTAAQQGSRQGAPTAAQQGSRQGTPTAAQQGSRQGTPAATPGQLRSTNDRPAANTAGQQPRASAQNVNRDLDTQARSRDRGTVSTQRAQTQQRSSAPTRSRTGRAKGRG